MNEKQEKAIEIRYMVESLNDQIKKAAKIGLTVEVKPTYCNNVKEDALKCSIVEVTVF